MTAPDDPVEPPPVDDTGAAPRPERTDTFAVSPDDLVVLARVASKAKVARDSIHDRDEKIAEAVTDHGVDVAVVAHATGLTPAEIAEIVFAQESNPGPFTRMRRASRARQAS